MARVKPNVFWIKDVSHADQTMGEMLEISRKLQEIEASLNAAIDAEKAKADALATPLRERMTAMGNGLAVYAEHNKDELFKERKTLELVFGRIGFRKSTELTTQPKITWAMVLGRLKDLAFLEAIRTREEPNRDVMREWPEERLSLVGARRTEKDVYWHELKEEQLKAE